MKREQFIKEVAGKMQNGLCDLFVGSGISAPSGLPTWSEFLDPYLSEIGIQQREEDNLPLLAQYVVNRNVGNRNIIYEAVYNTFGKSYPLNAYHKVISNFPVHTLWTTNYDCLLEQALSDRVLRVVASEEGLLHPHGNTEVEIIKLHGCARSATKGIVLTQADYDCFLDDKPKLSQRLREALINRSLFFVGYSYHDPNIQAIMTQAYQMMGRITTNMHFILLSEIVQRKDESDESFEQRKVRFELWITELNRVGIRELIVPRSDIVSVLKAIEHKARGAAVFVTGGHKITGETEKYAREIGVSLAEMQDVILNNGQSEGIGNAVLSSFMKKVFENKQDVNQRVHIFPNPYSISPAFSDDPSLIPELKRTRVPLVADSTLIVAFPGNMGTKAEIEVAREKERIVFPVLCDMEDYSARSVVSLLEDSENMEILKRIVPKYHGKLVKKELPTRIETIEAMQEIINGEIQGKTK